MDNDTPLLKSLGYERLLETMTPDDTQQAFELLDSFFRAFSGVGADKIAVLAYLFGVKQGIHEGRGPTDKKAFEAQLYRLYEMGKQHGLRQMALLFGVDPMFAPRFYFGHKPDGGQSTGKPPTGQESKNE